MRKNWIYIVIPLVLSIFVLWPIRSLGSWYPMHDTTHIARVYLMEQTIRGGQFPPIWAESINNGYGYPLFHFYAPLFYYAALVGKLISGTYITGLKLALFSFLFLGTAGVMKFASRWGRGASILAGTAFALSPYIALDIYVRGAFAEIAAMMLFPWTIVVWEKLGDKKHKITAGIVTTLFLISHNLIPVIAFPVILIWILLNHRKDLKKIIFPSLLTIMLSAFFVLPLIFERSFVKADTVARVTDFAIHFVYPSQIWNSTWGFGGSGAGIEDGLSFKMGKVQLLLAIFGMLYILWKKKFKYIFFPVALLFTLYMSTYLSKWIWEHISLLAVIQFPWRFLAIAASLISITAAYSATFFKRKLIRNSFIFLIIISTIYFNLKYFSPQWIFYDDESRYMSPQYFSTITSIIPEFMPVWMTNTPSESPIDDLTRAYYPTWKAELNGKIIKTMPDENGIIKFDLQDSSGNITITQSHTVLEKFSYLLTIIGIGLSIYLWRKK